MNLKGGFKHNGKEVKRKDITRKSEEIELFNIYIDKDYTIVFNGVRLVDSNAIQNIYSNMVLFYKNESLLPLNDVNCKIICNMNICEYGGKNGFEVDFEIRSRLARNSAFQGIYQCAIKEMQESVVNSITEKFQKNYDANITGVVSDVKK